MKIKDLQKELNKPKITRAYSFEKLQAEWAWEDALDKEFPIEASIKRLYRDIRRFVYNVPDMPRDAYRKVKRGVQRAYRGWADEDVWSLHHYHAKITYEMLLKLKASKMGVPMSVYPESVLARNNGDITDAESNVAVKAWDKLLDKMINAYKLNLDVANGDRENYMPYIPDNLQADFKCLTMRKEAERRLGMMYFNLHYFSLWD